MKTYIVDAFTNEPFKGNPAGVCMVDQPISESKMQSIASELNLSETAFIQAKEEPGSYSIRYFSPKQEIPLCGHATMASSKVLFEYTNLDEIHFKTIEKIDLHIEKSNGNIQMEFPVFGLKPLSAPEKLLAALGIEDVLYSGYNKETNILMIEVKDTDLLRNLKPDFNKLLASHQGLHGVLVTSKANDEYDFHSRFFWPWSGTNEDPVTGATHTFMGKYWSEKLGKSELRSFQSSERTGSMDISIISADKMHLNSNAVIVFEGDIKI